ncbi:MAG: hypothetical protein ACTSXA_00170 [Candidatus Heimdallarchaeota archaeon]
MCSSKRIPLVFLILTIIIFFQSYFIIGISAHNFPFDEFNEEGRVRRVINNEIDPDVYFIPGLNIIKLSNNIAESQLKLELYDPINLSFRFEYRILIGWNDLLRETYLWHWPDLDWYNVIPPESNITICVAGGASWYGLTNGSYSAYYDSKDNLVFNQLNNNSVSIFENNTLLFPINESYIEYPNSYTDVLVFTSYNATINSTTSDFYIDAMPFNLIVNMFDMYGPIGDLGYSAFYFFILVLLPGISIARYIKNKKQRI